MPTNLGARALKHHENPVDSLDLRSAYEVQYRLAGKCPSVAPVLDFCAKDTKEPYFVYKYLGTKSARSVLDKPGHFTISAGMFSAWLDHAINVVAPCVAAQNMIIYDMKPDHILLDVSGQHVKADEFALIDADGWPPASWFLPGRVSVEGATAINRFFLMEKGFKEFYGGISHKDDSEAWRAIKIR